jgi:uncharacterized membrane protein
MLRFMSSTSVVALFAGLVSVARADSITYTFTTIDAPLATSGTALSGINDSGQIVGTYFVNGAGSFGFLDTDGVFAIITPPGAISPGVSGINDAGQIIGDYTAGNGIADFIYAGGAFTGLSAPNSGGPGGGTALAGSTIQARSSATVWRGGSTLRASADSSTVLGHSPPWTSLLPESTIQARSSATLPPTRYPSTIPGSTPPLTLRR